MNPKPYFQDIDRLRHSATFSLFERRDTIVVHSTHSLNTHYTLTYTLTYILTTHSLHTHLHTVLHTHKAVQTISRRSSRCSSAATPSWYFIAEQSAPAPHLAHPEGCAALRMVLATVPRVSRSCERFSDGFDLHPLRPQTRYRA